MMKILRHALLLLLSTCISIATAQHDSPDIYSTKPFKPYRDFFENKRDLLNFFDIKNGEVIAGVGASTGYNEVALSLLYDSLTFYIEDVSSSINQHDIDKKARKFSKYKKGLQTSKFIWVAGSYSATNLPDGIFDKITMIASFHEFTEMDKMISDVSKKLKPNGKLYVMEAFCIDKVISCDAGHKGYFMKEVNTIMNRSGLYQTQLSSPESNVVNHVNILVFEKDKNKSTEFFNLKKELEPYIKMSEQLNRTKVAEDTLKIKTIIDSLQLHKAVLCSTYVVYESWIKNIALNWNINKDYQKAINVLKGILILFPNSIEINSELLKLYKKTNQEILAKSQLQKIETLKKNQQG